jgi:hypothetical protein
MEAICSSETSVDFHRTTLPYIPEDVLRSHVDPFWLLKLMVLSSSPPLISAIEYKFCLVSCDIFFPPCAVYLSENRMELGCDDVSRSNRYPAACAASRLTGYFPQFGSCYGVLSLSVSRLEAKSDAWVCWEVFITCKAHTSRLDSPT